MWQFGLNIDWQLDIIVFSSTIGLLR